MKPLYDQQFFQTKVLCLDISEDGNYVLAGYKKGALVLWDSAKFKIAHVMKDVAKNDKSDFSMVKILFTSVLWTFEVLNSMFQTSYKPVKPQGME